MDDVLTLTEAASYLKVDYTTALDYVQSGKLPAKQLPGRDGAKGNRWRVRSADLQAFLAPDSGPLSGPIDRKSPQVSAINGMAPKKKANGNHEWMQRYGGQ